MAMVWSYLAGALGAAVHHPVLLVLKQTAVLPAHALLLRVLHPGQSVLHHHILLRLTKDMSLHLVYS